MGEISFSTGKKTYTLNGCCEVSFNPTDEAFVKKLYNVFDSLDSKQEEVTARLEKAAGSKEVFAVSEELDAEMRGLLDGIFDKPICSDLFGSMNVYAMADGLPVWANFLIALLDETGQSYTKERGQTDKALEKYLAKYRT